MSRQIAGKAKELEKKDKKSFPAFLSKRGDWPVRLGTRLQYTHPTLSLVHPFTRTHAHTHTRARARAKIIFAKSVFAKSTRKYEHEHS